MAGNCFKGMWGVKFVMDVHTSTREAVRRILSKSRPWNGGSRWPRETDARSGVCLSFLNRHLPILSIYGGGQVVREFSGPWLELNGRLATLGCRSRRRRRESYCPHYAPPIQFQLTKRHALVTTYCTSTPTQSLEISTYADAPPRSTDRISDPRYRRARAVSPATYTVRSAAGLRRRPP